jgi:hypothetical protein
MGEIMAMNFPHIFDEVIAEKTSEIIIAAAVKNGHNVDLIKKWLAPISGSYAIHLGAANAFLTPLQIVRINAKVFKTCMKYTDRSITVSCIATITTCALTVVPGPQQPVMIMACQGMIVMTDKVMEDYFGGFY